MAFLNVYEQCLANAVFGRDALDKGEYDSCRFDGCDFSSADLSDCRFMDCTFTDCDFSNAQLTDTAFQDVVFKNCKLQGLVFADCNGFGFNVAYHSCQLNYSVFHRMKLQGIQITDSQLHSVDFSETDLGRASILRCDLRDATFEHTNLEKADLRGCRNYIINPGINRLKGARFSLPDVVGLLSVYGVKIEGA